MLQKLEICGIPYVPITLELLQSLEGLSCLQHVGLVQVCCKDLWHFDCLVALTSLTLCSAECEDLIDNFIMPEKLQVLVFQGWCLFDRRTQHNLQDLTALTTLTLGFTPTADNARQPGS